MAEIDLSISIVNYNTSKDVIALLESIYRHAKDVVFEVLLVDNASNDDVQEIVQSYPDVKFIKNAKNVFFTKADNQNLSRAKGKYIISINSDCLVTPGALQTMMHFLEHHQDVGAVAPKIMYPDGEIQASMSNFITASYGLMLFSGLTRVFPGNKIHSHVMPSSLNYDPGKVQDGEVLYGACIMTKQEVLATVGVKDEHLVHGWDEYDWSKRMTSAGWKLKYLPDATILHHRSLSREKAEKSSDAKKILDGYHWNGLLYLYKKHFGFMLYFLLKCMRTVSCCKSFVYRLLTGKR